MFFCGSDIPLIASSLSWSAKFCVTSLKGAVRLHHWLFFGRVIFPSMGINGHTTRPSWTFHPLAQYPPDVIMMLILVAPLWESMFPRVLCSVVPILGNAAFTGLPYWLPIWWEWHSHCVWRACKGVKFCFSPILLEWAGLLGRGVGPTPLITTLW